MFVQRAVCKHEYPYDHVFSSKYLEHKGISDVFQFLSDNPLGAFYDIRFGGIGDALAFT
jgi:hypothetical protein